MDREDIIKLAREACDQAPREDWNSTAWVFGDETLERFATLVAAAEREACASICFQEGPSIDGELIAEAIRARGEK